jgi:aminopeptidase N
MIATSFAPNEARKAFPCFDEPELKATFDITIRHPIKSYALSNSQELVCLYLLFSIHLNY